MVSTDALGPFPVTKSNNRYIIVITDFLTRWPEAFAVPTIDAPVIADLLMNEIIARHGAPRVLLSDRGTNFLSKLITEVCHLVNTEKVNTSAFHPQCNGLTERMNQTLAHTLSMYVSSDQTDWDKHIPATLFAYRVSPSEVTGESPFFLLYGRQPRLPMDVSLLPPREISASIADHRARIVAQIEEVQRLAKENIQRAQQKMKQYYDRDATPVSFDIGQRVWVYTPKNKRGLSKKLRHNWHGPYTLVARTSPVNYVIRAADNSRMSTTVHVSRMKPYLDPDSRPIRQPPTDVDDPYLQETDFPADSFEESLPSESTLPTQEISHGESNVLDDPEVFTAEKILRQRLYKGKPQFEVKWKGYRETSWEPLENILDRNLVTQYYRDHPRARNLVDGDDQRTTVNASTLPTIAAFAISYTRANFTSALQQPSHAHQEENKSSIRPKSIGVPEFSLPRTFLTAVFFTVIIGSALVHSSRLDASGKPITFYPDSLMLASNPQALVFYEDTTLVNVHVDLQPFSLGPVPTLNNSCSPQQKRFYDQLLLSVRATQRVIRRLGSFQGISNIIECDSFLRRYYFYITGKESQLICKSRRFASSLEQCRSWAKMACQSQSPDERLWFRSRTRREAWACHAGLFGVARWFWEHTGHSCEQNNIFGLIRTLGQIAGSMKTSQRLVQTLNGKTVFLIKTSDKLTTRVNGLSEALRDVDRTFSGWERELHSFANKEQCHYEASLEFLSKYTMQMNRALSSLLRLLELEDFTRQTEHITKRDLISYNDLPRSIATELSAQLSSLPALRATSDALNQGFPLLIRPLLDYDFTAQHKLKLNILFTVPHVFSREKFCTIQPLTPLKYNISGICFTGPMSRDDVMLVTCSNQRYFIKPAALNKCYRDDDTILCPKSLLLKASRTDWLGLPWSPNSRLSFQRHHRRAVDCSDLHELIHLGSRFYLGTSLHTITFRTVDGKSNRVLITPLSIFNVPCNISFDAQEIGLGRCPPKIEFSLPVFLSDQFSYVPWSPASNDTTFHLHYDSLSILPPLTFDNKTLEDLDNTFNVLDGQLTKQLNEVNTSINHLKPAATTTMNDVLTYISLSLTLVNSIIILLSFCCFRHLFVNKHLSSRSSSEANALTSRKCCTHINTPRGTSI